MIRARWKTILIVTMATALLGVGAFRRSAAPAAAAPAPPAEETPAPRDDHEERLGRLVVPDVVLTDQHGKSAHLYTDLVKGKAVAMSFIFTRCTTICPPLGLSFSRLQKLLGERAGRQINLISISIDPVNDTPERLLAWGDRYSAGPAWTLLTGPRDDVDKVLKALTVFTAAKEDHAPIVLLGNEPTGEWLRAYGLSSPTGLVEALDRLMGAPAPAPGSPR
jgi:cytochrome oxidase Cu insertion factor (SCO1/SenC/PrrC family)